MSWKSHLPDGINDLTRTHEGFQAGVEIPADEDGYIGRRCAACQGMFRMLPTEFNALPPEARLTCPYCGFDGDRNAFITEAQRERLRAAAAAVGEQYLHDEVDKMLKRALGGRSRSRSSGGFGVSIEVEPGRRPRPRSLPAIVEEKVLRTITCPTCANHYAIYGTTAFCPVCGPRAAADTVLDSIAAGRRALALEDHLPANERDAARAVGVFDRLAADTLKNVVTIFEVFAREQFNTRATSPPALKGNVFQRLDDTAQLFLAHCGIDVPTTAGLDIWRRLKEDFARRHVLIHCDGIVDAKFMAAVPRSTLQVGQRLVIRRADADRALDDTETVVRKLSMLP